MLSAQCPATRRPPPLCSRQPSSPTATFIPAYSKQLHLCHASSFARQHLVVQLPNGSQRCVVTRSSASSDGGSDLSSAFMREVEAREAAVSAASEAAVAATFNGEELLALLKAKWGRWGSLNWAGGGGRGKGTGVCTGVVCQAGSPFDIYR